MASNLKNLTRQPLIRSSHIKPNGLKSYVSAMRRYNFTPTVDGPYTYVKHVESQGQQALFKKTGSRVGGKTRVTGHVLAKKDPSTGQTGTVPATDVESGSEYLCPVEIGTPAQTLKLDFDTGSADLWVFSTELPSAQQTSAHTVFDPSKSSTWNESSGSTWQISYGDGSSASGDVGTDTVNLGGISIENQSVELAKTLSSEFASGEGDGLLGLAFGSINTVQPTAAATPVENMISQKDIPASAELFTAWLGDSTETSFYTFGFIDQDSLGGATPSYVDVDSSQGFWMFDSTSASVNGKTIDRSSNTAIADTGTTLALVGDDVCEAFYGAIKGAKQDSQQQGWVYPSSVSTADLPAVEFAVGSTLFKVNPEDVAFQDLGNGFIYGGIQSRGSQDFDIFGDVFLRSVYAVFDLNDGKPRFGAVQRAPSSGSSS
ncbi:Uu.00g029310.m01.CDS01 [Anthostomella pinea]|uniref:Uu.00g029310.m01.CDS01 n=1 Tax=Anthostomella pinea TaxID=933095 RepID=A0AAI8V388_9PEZI|nr:Uu.00g029310.m01.CDS01 [Anthostomella pinea]